MKRVKTCQVREEPIEDARREGRYHPSLEITFRDKTGPHTHRISAGHSDEIHVYREDGVTYVLARNDRLPCIGIEAFQGQDKVGELFLQEGQVQETLGRDDLASFTIIKRLQEYLME